MPEFPEPPDAPVFPPEPYPGGNIVKETVSGQCMNQYQQKNNKYIH
jgi:hypothetical protein